MLSFFQYLQDTIDEGNKLYTNVERPLSQGKEIGTVSSERGGMSRKERKTADKSLKGDLARLRSKGSIGGYKSAKGRYQYAEPKAGESGIAKEKSYVVRSGEGSKQRHFPKLMKALGKRYGQESIMRVKSDKSAEYQYPGKKEVDSQGKVVYNRPLSTGGGDTSFAGKQSFTTKK
jgi:hypothetical protein